MDLRLIPGAKPTDAERAAIDRALSTRNPEPQHPEPNPAPSTLDPEPDRSLLLPCLHAAQACAGWISAGALNCICERLSVPPAEAYGVASFYAMFSLDPRPSAVAHVCDDIACRTRGAEALCRSLEQRLGPAGAPALGGRAAWRRSPCLGQCERGPAVLLQRAGETPGDLTLAGATAEAIEAALETTGPASVLSAASSASSAPQTGAPRDPDLRLLRRVGVVDPASFDDYTKHGGCNALRRAFTLGPERVVREIIDARLVGRGGAAFSAGRKWNDVATNPEQPHYLMCNADESEPGTFKDRVLMEHDPFGIIEAMAIAAYATGCHTGFLYIRGEYPLATSCLETAIGAARAAGLLGSSVLGEPFGFDIELRRGAGAYICGEETALFNSIEGYRGEPRNKPPFPVDEGLFHRPTVVNNVETLFNVLDILEHGGQAFSKVGTEGSTGTKLFCLSGAVERPGVYEVPFGTTLRNLIERAGGVRRGGRLEAALLGGAAGVFVTPGELDMPLSFEGARAAGATLGSGAVILFDGEVPLEDVVLRIARFFRDESCGQCVPCRIGTLRQEEALLRLASTAGPSRADLAIVDDLARAMSDASICGLGQTASSAVQSAIRKFGLFTKGAM